jgi:hypothetical protein
MRHERDANLALFIDSLLGDILNQVILNKWYSTREVDNE